MAVDSNGIPIPSFNEAVASQQASIDDSTNVLNKLTGQVSSTSDPNDISLAALSDSHTVDPTQMFNVKKFDGTTGRVKGSDLKSVIASGDYTMESPEETQLREDDAKYGSGHTLEAATLGAARTLSFGGSDVALKASGAYTGDELRGKENANKAASIAGEVGGFVLPAILSGGTSLVAEGAAGLGAGVAGAEALGGLAEAGVKRFATNLTDSAVAKKIAANAAEKLSASEANTVVLVAQEAAAAGEAGMVSGKAAEGASSLMSKSLERAGYAASSAKNIAQRMLYSGLEHMAPEAANMAVQGALFGAGRLVTEDAFGTADFNAENLVAALGVGALAGGVFGAAIGGGKALIPSAKELLSPISNAIGDAIGKKLNPEAAALRLSELSPEQLQKVTQRQPEFVKNYTEEIGAILKENPTIKNNVDLQGEILNKLDSKKIEIGQAYDEADRIINQERPGMQQPVTVLQKKLQEVKQAFISSLDAGATSAQVEAVQNYGDRYITSLADRYGTSKQVTARIMQEEKAGLASRAYKGAIPTSEELSVKGLQKEFASVYQKAQENMLKEAGSLSNNPLLSEKFLADKKTFQTLINGSKNSEKIGFRDIIDPSMWDAVGVKEFATGAILGGKVAVGVKLAKEAFNSFGMQKRLVMGTLDSSIRSAQIATSKGLAAMSKGAQILGNAAEPSIVRGLVSSELAVKNSDGKKIKPKDESEAYNNVVDNANVAVTDPERVLQHSNKQTSAMFDHAPNTAAAVDAKYLQTLQFLASKAPKSNKNLGIFDAQKQTKRSGFDIAKMSRYLDAIENPKMMLQKAAQGKLSREHVEVMSTLYPQMHNAMKTATMDFIAKKGTDLKYNQKLQLGLLLGMQAHESMQPQNVQALQAQFAPEQPAQGDGEKYNASAVGDMAKAKEAATITQDHEIGD